MVKTMTLTQKLERIGTALVSGLTDQNEEVLCHVYHYRRPMMPVPYCVWAEDGEDGAFNGDDRKGEQVISGYIDYFTKTEYDPLIDQIQTTLLNLQGDIAFSWNLYSVQYEDDTNLIHYQWLWRVS